VVGDGPLGLLGLLLLRTMSPAELVLVSRRPARGLAGKDCGATLVVDSRDAAALADLAGRFDLVVDTTSTPEGPASTLGLLRRGGTAVLLGISGEGRATIDPDTITLGHLRVYGIFAASRAAWQWAVQLFATGGLDPAPLVTHRFALDDLPEALETLRSPSGGAIKVLVRPGAVQPGDVRPGGVQSGGVQPLGVRPGDVQSGGAIP
jgi:threonine dehydrogenase-like Zn-dependent dehydrogenase